MLIPCRIIGSVFPFEDFDQSSVLNYDGSRLRSRRARAHGSHRGIRSLKFSKAHWENYFPVDREGSEGIRTPTIEACYAAAAGASTGAFCAICTCANTCANTHDSSPDYHCYYFSTHYNRCTVAGSSYPRRSRRVGVHDRTAACQVGGGLANSVVLLWVGWSGEFWISLCFLWLEFGACME